MNVLKTLRTSESHRHLTSVAVHVLDAKPAQDTVDDLLDVMISFIRAEFASMDSFVVVVDGIGWASYEKYLTALLAILQSGHILDGYLQFNVPSKSGHSITGSVAESLQIAQLITNIQTVIQEYNAQLEATDCNDKKLILSLPSLMLHAQHRKFLRFWFGGDKYLCGGHQRPERYVLY